MPKPQTSAKLGDHWHAYMAFGGAFGEKDRIMRKPVPVRRGEPKEFAGWRVLSTLLPSIIIKLRYKFQMTAV